MWVKLLSDMNSHLTARGAGDEHEARGRRTHEGLLCSTALLSPLLSPLLWENSRLSHLILHMHPVYYCAAVLFPAVRSRTGFCVSLKDTAHRREEKTGFIPEPCLVMDVWSTTSTAASHVNELLWMCYCECVIVNVLLCMCCYECVIVNVLLLCMCYCECVIVNVFLWMC